MNQIHATLKVFQEWHENMGLRDLWFSCDAEVQAFYPDLEMEYESDTAFFKALEVLLESGDQCLFYNLNHEDQSKDGQHLSGTPSEQLSLLKKVWVGKVEMDKMDDENGFLGWYFLLFCPYSLAHKIYDENDVFLRWWHAE